jgi:hypothetical protein
MNTRDLTDVLPTLLSELVHGSTDSNVATSILNRGDAGLLRSLDRLSASAASAAISGGSIAAHVDHLRYGLSRLNQWFAGEGAPWASADWTMSWRKPSVSDAEWRALREELRREADAWRDALRTPRNLNDTEARWVIGSIAHLAYHLGAIRQIDRSTRGPTAEEEVRLRIESQRLQKLM